MAKSCPHPDHSEPNEKEKRKKNEHEEEKSVEEKDCKYFNVCNFVGSQMVFDVLVYVKKILQWLHVFKFGQYFSTFFKVSFSFFCLFSF